MDKVSTLKTSYCKNENTGTKDIVQIE